MSMTSDILVVSADPSVLSGRVTALRRSGFGARASASFPDARRLLEEGPPPEVLVTDVRLGPYNGLHLVAVARVEFYDGATKLGEDTTAPYEFTWTNPSTGAHTITARAIDNAGATAVSSSTPVTVTI